MAHDHHHGSDLHDQKLLWVTGINVGILVLELIGGLLANSLALLSDAVHKLGDVLSLAIAWLAGRFARKKADYKNTFGYKRIEILAALFNALTLVAICVFLLVEAWERFRNPEAVRGGLMLTVALVGLVADWVCVLILQKNKKENINVKAAYLHLLGDALSSVAVIVGGVVILLWGIEWVDPAITAVVALYLIGLTWGVVKESVDILMQATPGGVDLDEIQAVLESVPEVENIHHIHLWRMNDSKIYFECHVGLRENLDLARVDLVRHTLESLLDERFGITHTTLQFEYRCGDGQGLIVPVEDEDRCRKTH
jgi:cobalt-zinc-cadmium efflux system protein